MPTWSHYHVSQSIQDALLALRAGPAPVCPVAGGTDLLLELQQGHHSPVQTLVDLSRIPELAPLEVRGDELFIGAGVPVSQITESPLVKQHARAVSEACGLIGGPQVRNNATLGGNVAHALPAADGMIGLVAMDAQVEIADLDENGAVRLRRQPMLSLFAGPGKSTLTIDREIVTGFYLALIRPGQASAFARVMRPQGVALPIMNLSVWVDRDGERVRDLRIAVGPAGPTPQRATVVENSLRGCPFVPEMLAQAEAALSGSMRFRTSARRATGEYRHHLSGGLFASVFQTAWERAAASQPQAAY